ncbi:MAG TPA: hypothetical protein H9938_00755 [Candidatus Alistipes stercoripullorum]|jgi:hypothetical protein|nr:hypothetical protein [Candidatus Alistipes stercoripullorum]
MNVNNNAAPATYSGNGNENRSKDNNFPAKLSFHQKRVYDLLSNGGQYSAADISTALLMSDPRSVIRDLRVKGVNIADEWFKSEHGGRFKRYFIHGYNAGKEVRNE